MNPRQPIEEQMRGALEAGDFANFRGARPSRRLRLRIATTAAVAGLDLAALVAYIDAQGMNLKLKRVGTDPARTWEAGVWVPGVLPAYGRAEHAPTPESALRDAYLTCVMRRHRHGGRVRVSTGEEQP